MDDADNVWNNRVLNDKWTLIPIHQLNRQYSNILVNTTIELRFYCKLWSFYNDFVKSRSLFLANNKWNKMYTYTAEQSLGTEQ